MGSGYGLRVEGSAMPANKCQNTTGPRNPYEGMQLGEPLVI